MTGKVRAGRKFGISLRLLRTVVCVGMPCALYAQPPAINQEGVRNSASNMPPSLPGGSLAPGSLFIIDGLRLARPDAKPVVHVIAPGGTVEAQLISAGAERLEALLPPETPQGDAQLVVTREGLSSRPYPVPIGPAFGIFSRNRLGWGSGEISNHEGVANTPAAPARLGASATLVGTGMRASSAEVFVGGVRERVLSQVPQAGRNGRLEITFQISKTTPRGCHTPVLVRVGKTVSNVVTMSVARQDGACQDEPWPPALIVLARVMMKARFFAGVPVDFTEDIGAAFLPLSGSAADFPPFSELLPPLGGCTTYTGRWPDDFTALVAGKATDTGERISISGSAGNAKLTRKPEGFYSGKLGGGIPVRKSMERLFLDPGEFTISALGGRDIGAWSAKGAFQTTLEPLLPVRSEIIDRSQGATVIWAGAKPDENVLIIAANIDPLSGGAGFCLCMAPGKAGKWRVPALPLSNLPPSRGPSKVPLNYLLVATLPAKAPQSFSAAGLPGGTIIFSSVRGRAVAYK